MTSTISLSRPPHSWRGFLNDIGPGLPWRISPDIGSRMRGWLTRVIAGSSLAVFLTVSNVADAGSPFDFLRAIGNSIAHPQKKTRSHSKSSQQSASKEASASPSPSASLGAPNERNIHKATAVPETKGEKQDVPFGIPVPGMKGLVSSPFAPDSGYVDVSKFPPGKEVKDPFTGKIFRTP